jgi:hypothetical protein
MTKFQGVGRNIPKKSLEVKKYMNWKETQEIRKKIMTTQRFRKHAELRKYAKLCKEEGIVSDRVRMSDGQENLTDKEGNHTSSDTISKQKKKKNPFESAQKEAKIKQAEKEKLQDEKKSRDLEIEKAKQARNKKRQRHLERSQRGQPNLNNQIKDILSKLQS